VKSALLYLLPALYLTACTSQPDKAAEKAADAPTPAPTVTPGTPAAAPATGATATDTTALLNALIQDRFPKLQVVDFKAGDINADGRADLIVVADQPCGQSDQVTDDSRCRTVLLVVAETGAKLRIAATNTHLVECSDCGGVSVGDPHQQIVIKGNYFSFESLYGSCDKTAGFVTFRYDQARRDWLLHRLGRVDYSCQDTTATGEMATRETQQTAKDFGVVRFAKYALSPI
jgi:hypothetical protein